MQVYFLFLAPTCIPGFSISVTSPFFFFLTIGSSLSSYSCYYSSSSSLPGAFFFFKVFVISNSSVMLIHSIQSLLRLNLSKRGNLMKKRAKNPWMLFLKTKIKSHWSCTEIFQSYLRVKFVGYDADWMIPVALTSIIKEFAGLFTYTSGLSCVTKQNAINFKDH